MIPKLISALNLLLIIGETAPVTAITTRKMQQPAFKMDPLSEYDCNQDNIDLAEEEYPGGQC